MSFCMVLLSKEVQERTPMPRGHQTRLFLSAPVSDRALGLIRLRTVEVLQRFALYVHPFGEDCLSFHRQGQSGRSGLNYKHNDIVV